MNVNVQVKNIDLSRALAKAQRTGHEVTTQVTIAAREDTKPYVPYVTGALRATAETESRPEEGLLVWGNSSVPYARAQYYGLPNKTWPGTCMQWFESARAANMMSWVAIAKKAVGELCNG